MKPGGKEGQWKDVLLRRPLREKTGAVTLLWALCGECRIVPQGFGRRALALADAPRPRLTVAPWGIGCPNTSELTDKVLAVSAPPRGCPGQQRKDPPVLEAVR